MATSGMTAGQPAEPGKFISFEQFLAAMDRIAAEAAERKKESAEEFRELKRLHAETERVLREVGEQMKENERMMAESSAKTERMMAESSAKTDRMMAESSAKTERMMAESSAKTDRRLDRLSQNVGGLSHSLGELVEALVAARLWEKFEMYGLERGFQRVSVYDGKRAVAEIDILLSNTDCAMAVEVKTHLDKMEYVDRHIARMELIRKFPPA
ncbi:MAG: hypothetical protein LBK61_12040, partial [Spirochaetaceae bacterium]|nr:hypothetical protein [Spirochaetaceae bacterium]